MKKFLSLLLAFFSFLGVFAIEIKEDVKKDEFLILQTLHQEVLKSQKIISHFELDERTCDEYNVLEKAKYESLKATSKNNIK